MNTPPTDKQIIQSAVLVNLALMSGMTAFLGFAIYQMISGRGADIAPKDPWVFLAVTFGVFFSCQTAAAVMKRVREPMLLKENAAEQYLQSVIVRMAIHEGAAMIGIVGLLMFGRSNPLPAHPETALFLIPYFFLIASGLSNFPTLERFQDQVRLAKENEALRRKTS
jgi:hypothetical protein